MDEEGLTVELAGFLAVIGPLMVVVMLLPRFAEADLGTIAGLVSARESWTNVQDLRVLFQADLTVVTRVWSVVREILHG